MKVLRAKRVISFCLALIITLPLLGEPIRFTPHELEYIANAPPIKIAYFDRTAPLIYRDSNQEPQGIFKRVADLVLGHAGLKGEYHYYSDRQDIFTSDEDLMIGVSPEYAPPQMSLSQPYLRVQTVLYFNKRVNPDQLSEKWFSAVEGINLPVEIDLNYVHYYPTREESILAVENGKADYGYANIFSVAYYSIKESVRNIVTIPQEQGVRLYSFGVLKDDKILLSIIDKVIASIDENTLNNLIISEASKIERRVSVNVIFETYGKWLVMVSALIVIILVISTTYTIRANRRLKLQNIRYEALSQISNECLYEYHTKDGRLLFSQQCLRLFGSGKQLEEARVLLADALQVSESESSNFSIRLPEVSGGFGTYKTTTLHLEGSDAIIGKLVDVSEEEAEKRELIVRSQVDGLSKVLNSTAVKEAIAKEIEEREGDNLHFFFLIDVDDFKEINDTYGHLVGDQVLSLLGRNLRTLFSNQGIVGRIGGDEFCVYIPNATTIEEVILKYEALVERMEDNVGSLKASLSGGLTEVKEGEAFEEFFQRADSSLYKAKQSGKNQLVVAP